MKRPLVAIPLKNSHLMDECEKPWNDGLEGEVQYLALIDSNASKSDSNSLC
jgi:hypothetical protein